MSINWFTVIAQVVNFLILVWLLKRYLYKPILKAIDEREGKITSQLKEATKKESEAKKEREDFESKNEDFDKQKNDLMNKAMEDVRIKREDLLDKARKDADDLRKKLEDILNEDQEHLSNEIMRMTKTEVFSIAKKVLKELADCSVDKQIVTLFIERLKSMSDDEKEKLLAALKAAKEIIVQTAFELAPSQRMEVEKTVTNTLHLTTEFQFKIAPELIGGIELNANGYKIGWNISEYLFSIKKTIEELIESKEKGSSINKKVHKDAKE